MYLPTIFSSLATLLAVTAAVPLGPDTQKLKPTPTPSRPITPSVSPSSSTYRPATVTPVGAYSCPQQQYKQCCQSLQEASQDVTQKLGEVVPILGGLQISSKISFQCKDMKKDQDPNTCQGHGYTPMCCTSQPGGDVNMCKPFEAAKEEYYKTFGYSDEDQVDVINDALS
ncbi:uncharacterized protein N7459_008194 [Penicillium hispanicum]|uniref:uncharacterized protein n=1 Tax=Penicillium hispanicum TaxID=1080232 RepID=UPI00254208E0|nr:uncharacterized protein N7459_008194 [Penicillium hispanicum]KAJ5573767.1 hypothetical protein N7459_008194 [Penicillium hispanicum]